MHLPDVCKLGVPPSAPEKKEKLKQEEINSANDWETQRDGAGPAWEAAMPSGLLQCPCLCNADICVTHLCVCLGWGLPSRVSSLWFCFPCLPQQKPLTTACLDMALSVQQKMSGPSTCFGSVFHCCCFDFFETRPHCIFLVVLELTL